MKRLRQAADFDRTVVVVVVSGAVAIVVDVVGCGAAEKCYNLLRRLQEQAFLHLGSLSFDCKAIASFDHAPYRYSKPNLDVVVAVVFVFVVAVVDGVVVFIAAVVVSVVVVVVFLLLLLLLCLLWFSLLLLWLLWLSLLLLLVFVVVFVVVGCILGF